MTGLHDHEVSHHHHHHHHHKANESPVEAVSDAATDDTADAAKNDAKDGATITGTSSHPEHDFQIVTEEVKHHRFLTLFHRLVRFPSGQHFAWDVVGHSHPEKPHLSGQFVCVFPFDRKTGTVTLIREYLQGPHKLGYSLPCGGYSRKQHHSLEEAARHELSEEAHLTGGELVPLLPEDLRTHGVIEGKWSTNRFTPFLLLDGERDAAPRARDREEFILVEHGVSMERLHTLMLRGELLLHSVQTAFMAVEHLRAVGFLPPVAVPLPGPVSVAASVATVVAPPAAEEAALTGEVATAI